MTQKFFCLLAVICMLFLSIPALAADNGGDPLTMSELTAWADQIKAMAMAASPLNDPTEEAAYSEDGYCFIYEFGTLYMDRPEMTEEARINTFVIYAAEDSLCLRGVQPDYLYSEVLNAYYTENSDLVGTHDFAVLYLTDSLPNSASWGWIQRDGQRIQTIQYAAHEQLADGTYTNAGVIYTIQDNLVAAIRAYGLTDTMTGGEVNEELDQIREVAQSNEYSMVTTSLIGTDLEMFERDDLIFSGMDFLTSAPEDLEEVLGQMMEDNWMEDDNGEFLRFMEFEGCTLTYVYDASRENPVLDSMSISFDVMEGPRAIRIGDSFSSVLNRFRNGEGSYDESTGIEVLYGDGFNAPTATAEYGNDASAVLRYSLEEDGRVICMAVSFEQMSVIDITLYTQH